MEHNIGQGRSKRQYRSNAIGCLISFVGLTLTIIFILLSSCTSDEISTDCLGEEIPDLICTEQMDLVCGCNGTSYVNPCYAQKAGVLRYRPQIMDEPTDICRPF